MMTKVALFFLVLSVTSCASSGPPPGFGGLDVAMDDSRIAVLPAPGSEPGVAVAAEDVVDWRDFFKAPPTPEQRDLLSQKLKQKASASTPKELIENGRNQMALGRLTDAEISFREAARKDPRDLTILLDLAQLYLQKNDLTMSFEFLSQAKRVIDQREVTAVKDVFRYRYILAVAYIHRGDHDLGHRVLTDLVGLDQSFVHGYAALATSYLRLGRQAVAEFIVKRGIDRAGDDASLYNVLGAVALQDERIGEARHHFDRALELDPHYAQAMINRAHLSIVHFDYEAAELDLAKAAEANPNLPEVFVALGLLQRRQGQLQRAKESFEKALAVAPQFPSARMNLALLLAEDLNDEHRALQLFYEVVQITSEGSPQQATAKQYIDQIHQARQAL